MSFNGKKIGYPLSIVVRTKSSPSPLCKRGVEGGFAKGRRRGILKRAALALAPAVLIMITPLTASAEGRGYLDITGGYKTGDFGTPTRSDLYYLSPTLGYVAPRYDVSVTAPYLSLTNKTGDVSDTETDVGDVILRGGVVLLPENGGRTSLDGALAVKLPTADETKGLGTGETDYGAFLSLHQRLDAVKLSLMGGYIKVGDPAGIDYNDISLYGVGISRTFRRTNLYASFEGRRAIVPGAENPREIHIGFFHILTMDYSIKGSAFVGLNDGGPASGMNLGIIRWF